MKKLIFFLILTCLLLTSCGQKVSAWQEQYDLGVRYLSEGKYEEAIIAFTAAIEIDPKKPEAYLDLAHAYIGQNDFDKAAEILKQGYELTQDERLKAKLDEIEKGNITDYRGNVRKMSQYDGNGSLVWYHIYDYDSNGRQTDATSYDAAGAQTGHVKLSYGKDGEELVDYWYFTEDGTLGRIVNEYENGNLIKCQHYSEEDELDVTEVFQYDEQGNTIRKDWYYETGEHDYDLYFYDTNGRQKRIERYDEDGTLYGKYVYRYDENGNKIEYGYYDAEGNLIWRYIYRYDEDGKSIGYDWYDGDGNLTSSTVYD